MKFDDEDEDDGTPTEHDLERIYGSKYLSAASVGDRKMKTKIRKVRQEELRSNDGTKQSKFVLYLENVDKPMVLNTTNIRILVKAVGRVPRNWEGAGIVIYAEDTAMGAGLRLRVLAAAPTKSGPSSPDGPGRDDMDDDIPF